MCASKVQSIKGAPHLYLSVCALSTFWALVLIIRMNVICKYWHKGWVFAHKTTTTIGTYTIESILYRTVYTIQPLNEELLVLKAC